MIGEMGMDRNVVFVLESAQSMHNDHCPAGDRPEAVDDSGTVREERSPLIDNEVNAGITTAFIVSAGEAVQVVARSNRSARTAAAVKFAVVKFAVLLSDKKPDKVNTTEFVLAGIDNGVNDLVQTTKRTAERLRM